jgi:hypothetical protein
MIAYTSRDVRTIQKGPGLASPAVSAMVFCQTQGKQNFFILSGIRFRLPPTCMLLTSIQTGLCCYGMRRLTALRPGGLQVPTASLGNTHGAVKAFCCVTRNNTSKDTERNQKELKVFRSPGAGDFMCPCVIPCGGTSRRSCTLTYKLGGLTSDGFVLLRFKIGNKVTVMQCGSLTSGYFRCPRGGRREAQQSLVNSAAGSRPRGASLRAKYTNTLTKRNP